MPVSLASFFRPLLVLLAGLLLVACAAADETRLTLVTAAGQQHAFSVEVVQRPNRGRGA